MHYSVKQDLKERDPEDAELNGLHYFSQIYQLDQSFFHERSELRESLSTSSMVCSLGNRVEVSSSRRKQDNW